MPDPSNLPYLLELLDDPSGVVRDAVARELAAFGPRLNRELVRLHAPPTLEQRVLMRDLLAEHARTWLKEAWPVWYGAQDEKARLETALGLIATFQDGLVFRMPLGALLDRLAEEFRLWRRNQPKHEAPALSLARYLFTVRGLQGARTDYYHPRNSNLVYVIETGRGIPISLACVYILVGRRAELAIEGCNWPGHFYARTHTREGVMLVDCFNEGRWTEEEAFLSMQGPSRDAARSVLREEPGAERIVSRVLHNLIRAYQQIAGWEDSALMVGLLKDLKRREAHGEEDVPF